LEWRRYLPTSTGPWPTVLLVHGGQWEAGSPYQGIVEQVAEDLQTHGFYVLVPTYRLAPCGRITGQPPHDSTPAGELCGRPLQQIADIKSLVRAARAESNCKDGEVAVVGGSAGGTHAIWVALDTTTSSDWTADDRPNCAVSLSGGYDLSDQDPTDTLIDETVWIDSVQNYTNTCNRLTQKTYSPVSIVTSPTSTVPFKPIFLVNGSDDHMIPSREIFDMECALIHAEIPSTLYEIIQITDEPYNDDHSFNLWRDPLDDGSGEVRDKILAFLRIYIP
jgi:acetyl esterase/lipase